MITHKDIFSNLKKCNQIGKKLSNDGQYLLVSGMMIGHYEQEMDETEANGLSIAFIENKVLSKMDAIPFLGIKINGDELYQASQKYEFDRFTVDTEYLNIEFNAMETTEESFNNDFKCAALEKGFDENTIVIGLSSNFNNDIDLYEFFIKYKKAYKPSMHKIKKIIKCKIIHNENKILKKSKHIIDDISKSKFLTYKELQPEIYERLYEASQPIEIKLHDENNTYALRLMKSLLNGATSKSICELRLLESMDFLYLIIELTIPGFIICNIYKVVNYSD